MRTAPACDQTMSKEGSPAQQSKPTLATEADETITLVSHTFGLTELTASLEALNAEADESTVVHHTQTSYASGTRKISGSPDGKDQKKSSPIQGNQPKRYVLQIWLEIEVGPGFFVPSEDDSYSVDFAMKVIN